MPRRSKAEGKDTAGRSSTGGKEVYTVRIPAELAYEIRKIIASRLPDKVEPYRVGDIFTEAIAAWVEENKVD